MARSKKATETAVPENIKQIVALMEARGVPAPQPVDAEYVMGLWQYQRRAAEEVGLRNYIAESRMLMDMRHPVQIPKEYRAITKEVRTPYYRDAGFHITASLTKNQPVRHAVPLDEGTDAQKAAAIAGVWHQAQIEEMDSLINENVTYESAKNLVFDSESVIKTVHRPDAWANFPVRQMDENGNYTEGPNQFKARVAKHRKGAVRNPFARRVVDRISMVFGDGEFGDEWCIEAGEYPLPYLDRRYAEIDEVVDPVTKLGGKPIPLDYPAYTPNGVSAATGRVGRTLKLEYWDAFQWHVVINGKDAPGFPKPNPYCPLLPYHRAVSYPALYALRYLVPALDALLTMQENWAYLGAFPIPVFEAMAGVQQMLDGLPVGSTSEPPAAMKWSPGKAWFPPTGYTMRFLEPPQTGADLRSMISELRDLIDIAGIPSVLRGIGGARQPGYSINQLMSAAQVGFQQLGNALERQDESQARFLRHAVEYTIGDEVYALGEDGGNKRWVALSGLPKAKLLESVAPVSELGPPKTTFRPVLPTDEQAEAMVAMQLTNPVHPLISDEYAQEHYLHIEDPVAMNDQIEVDKALKDPQLQADMMAQARREVGLPVGVSNGTPHPEPPTGISTTPNDQTMAGEPTVPGLTQAVGAGQGTGEPVPTPVGGRAAGAYPGLPTNQG